VRNVVCRWWCRSLRWVGTSSVLTPSCIVYTAILDHRLPASKNSWIRDYHSRYALLSCADAQSDGVGLTTSKACMYGIELHTASQIEEGRIMPYLCACAIRKERKRKPRHAETKTHARMRTAKQVQLVIWSLISEIKGGRDPHPSPFSLPHLFSFSSWWWNMTSSPLRVKGSAFGAHRWLCACNGYSEVFDD
jgi:hypothetical protein